VKRFAASLLEATLDTMIARSGSLVAQSRTPVATAAAALSMIVIAAGAAWSQGPPATPATQGTSAPPALGVREPPPQAAPQPGEPAPPPPASEANPGLMNEMGKLFEKSLSILPKMKSPGETIDDLNARAKDAAKDAGESLSNLAKPSAMVSGRSVCPVAANGAPDCKIAADKLCQSKGYKEGKSLNMDSAESCSAKVLIPGRTRKPDDCRTDNFVTRAMCQ
jgi:hypothetical protein